MNSLVKMVNKYNNTYQQCVVGCISLVDIDFVFLEVAEESPLSPLKSTTGSVISCS